MGNSGSSGNSRKARSLPNSPEAHRLPSPYNKQSGVGGGAGVGPGGATSIPLPATVAATRRCPPDKVRPAPAPTHQSPLGIDIELEKISRVKERPLTSESTKRLPLATPCAFLAAAGKRPDHHGNRLWGVTGIRERYSSSSLNIWTLTHSDRFATAACTCSAFLAEELGWSPRVASCTFLPRLVARRIAFRSRNFANVPNRIRDGLSNSSNDVERRSVVLVRLLAATMTNADEIWKNVRNGGL
uniref:Uncharacterized protein n=1 Tax=Vespula pensylvanica TaxID=30213 RepID=A0A834PDG3_VESPE|nr:hypothetical protein H0235_004178 [Vespula pensylvanica]